MKVSKSTLFALAVLGTHLKTVGKSMASPPEGETPESTLKGVTGHLVTLGTALETGNVAMLGMEVEEPSTKAKKAATAEDEPDFTFYALSDDTDAAAPTLVDVKGTIVAVTFNPKGLARAIHAAAKHAEVAVTEFVPFPNTRVSLSSDFDAVCSLTAYLAKYGSGMSAKLRKAYDELEVEELDGLVYDQVPNHPRGVTASPASKERSAKRAELDQKRPFSEDELTKLPKSDLMTVASLCGLDPVKLDTAGMIKGILEADAQLKRNPTTEEITAGVESLTEEELRELVSAESLEVGETSDMTLAELRKATKLALIAKHVPAPSEELPF